MTEGNDPTGGTDDLSLCEKTAPVTHLAPDRSRMSDAEKQGGPAALHETSILDKKENGAKDINLVTWDGPDDTANPLNWSASVKFTNIGIVSALTFITPLASSMLAPGIPLIENEFHNHNLELASFVLSVYILGFAIGPMILAPMSELYGNFSQGPIPSSLCADIKSGRLYIYHICNVGFLVFTVACAVSTNTGMLTVLRFFQGCFGAAPVTNGK